MGISYPSATNDAAPSSLTKSPKVPNENNMEIDNVEVAPVQRQMDVGELVVDASNKKIWKWIRKIRANGVSIEEFFKQDKNADTELTRVVRQGLESAGVWLIEAIGGRSDLLDLYNSDVHTALHLAVMLGSATLTRKLVLSGANAKLITEDGNTPLHLACMSNDLDCLKALTLPFAPEELAALQGSVENQPRPSVNLEAKNGQGKTCLHLAVRNRNEAVVHHLLESGADVNTTENLTGKAALHLAAEDGTLRFVHLLAQNKNCDWNQENYAGSTAYEVAVNYGHLHVCHYLYTLGADTRYREEEEKYILIL